MLWAKSDVYGYICNIREHAQQYNRKKKQKALARRSSGCRGEVLSWPGLVLLAQHIALL